MEKITKEAIQDLTLKNEIELSSIHRKLCVPIIKRILANFSIERIPTNRTSATIVVEWMAVVFDEMDWDTEAKINMLNEQDAIYNNMTIQQIIDILK